MKNRIFAGWPESELEKYIDESNARIQSESEKRVWALGALRALQANRKAMEQALSKKKHEKVVN